MPPVDSIENSSITKAFHCPIDNCQYSVRSTLYFSSFTLLKQVFNVILLWSNCELLQSKVCLYDRCYEF